MKKSIFALAIMAMAGSAMACYNCAPIGKSGSQASTSGSNSVLSGSSSFAVSSGNGFSGSWAENTTTSSAKVSSLNAAGINQDVNRGICTTDITGKVSISGDVTTSSLSRAGNISDGSATGGGAAGGLATAEVSGAGLYGAVSTKPIGAVGGTVVGAAGSLTANGVVAGRNEAGVIYGANQAGFEASASSDLSLKGSGKADTYGCTTCGMFASEDKKKAETSAINYSFSQTTGPIGNATTGGVNGGFAGSAAVAFANAKISNAVPVNSGN